MANTKPFDIHKMLQLPADDDEMEALARAEFPNSLRLCADMSDVVNLVLSPSAARKLADDLEFAVTHRNLD